MFGILAQVWNGVTNFVIGVEAIKDDGSADDYDGILHASVGEGSSKASNFNKETSVNKLKVDNQTFHGTVTSLYSGRGLINDHIYFSLDSVIGNARLKIGIKVTVEATRAGPQGGWVAKKVSLFNEWNVDSAEKEEVNEINGIVSYFNVVSGLINDRYSFTKAVCTGTYHPMVNDFVSCKIRTVGGLDEEVMSVRPLRERQFVGSVTNLINRYGFVDDDIFFPLGACRGYSPRKGDCVFVTAIESKQRKSDWRAYRVERCSDSLKAKYGDSSKLESSNGNSNHGGSYSRYNRKSRGNARNGKLDRIVLPGQRIQNRKRMFLPKHLKNYEVPRTIQDCILEGGDISNLIPDVLMPLSMENHRSKLDSLLFAEEIEMSEAMREFDMESVTLRKFDEYLVLAIPGLAEGRPSVLIGDRVVVDVRDSPEHAPRYEGCVHKVRAEDVLLKFNEGFHRIYRNEDCDVQFFFNRTMMRRLHQAVEYGADLGKDVLFPSVIRTKAPLTPRLTDRKGMRFFNKILNSRQKLAVERIVTAECRPMPYILFGPPGTGKTVTVVEAILQVHKNIPSCRILACAPSNSASDLIAQRLIESNQFSKGELIRLNAFQRQQDVPESIEPYCTNDTDDIMLKCRYRLIVCTCSMAGILYCAGLQSGHFTHVFVDEAGQATEPECLIAAGMLAGNEDGQLVLAGDPHQLGPVLQSPISLHHGLGTSYLERLVAAPIYARNVADFADCGCYDPLLVTKLVNNYRSHEALLNLSSTLFYHGELLPCANAELVNSFAGADFLPDKNFPIIFNGTEGEDMREDGSPSWFNPAEALRVVKCVQQVVSWPDRDLTTDDIAVVTPYRKQVEKIRLLLEQVNLEGVKVGSVEEFQGQERQVIIISTVRSSASYVSFDQRHALGFLSNPKRFNVAITRAQALLIVIGNPHILCMDPYWCALVQYCVANCAYTGCELPSLHDPLVKSNFEKALTMLGLAMKISGDEDGREDQESPEQQQGSAKESIIVADTEPKYQTNYCDEDNDEKVSNFDEDFCDSWN